MDALYGLIGLGFLVGILWLIGTVISTVSTKLDDRQRDQRAEHLPPPYEPGPRVIPGSRRAGSQGPERLEGRREQRESLQRTATLTVSRTDLKRISCTACGGDVPQSSGSLVCPSDSTRYHKSCGEALGICMVCETELV